jgi:integrase
MYRVRVAIPQPLRATAKALYGVRAEFIENLKTKSRTEAKARAPAAVARLQGKLSAIRRAAEGAPDRVSERDIEVLAGEWFRDRVDTFGDDPGRPETWECARDVLYDQLEPVDPNDPESELELALRANDKAAARGLLAENGLPIDAATVTRMATALFHAACRFIDEMAKRAEGDWTPRVDTFPRRRPPAPPAAPARLTFDDLLSGWARDHGYRLDVRPIERAAYDRLRTLERLASFVGHRDAAKVTKADAVRWKEEAQSRGLTAATIRNDVSEMSAVWRWAIRSGKLEVNPFEGVAPPKEKRRKQHQRRAFTDAEAAAILTAARGKKGFMRWLPWVCCLTGARLSEVCQSVKEDVMEMDGVTVLRIHDEGDSDDNPRWLKNEDSRRDIPIHPALTAEGFLDYVRRLPARSPLFPDARPDEVFGRRSTIAGRQISRWLKQELKITDPRISPNHSWRHYFVSACRRVEMHPEVRSALTGHSAKMDESAHYGDGMGSFVRLLAANIAKVQPPLPT